LRAATCGGLKKRESGRHRDLSCAVVRRMLRSVGDKILKCTIKKRREIRDAFWSFLRVVQLTR
jgi:hypothetical protein